MCVWGAHVLGYQKKGRPNEITIDCSTEEAVNEVKRQAMDEVQKAVAEAEQKAFEMIASERAKMEKTLVDAKKKAKEDAVMVINEQEDSSEVSPGDRSRRFYEVKSCTEIRDSAHKRLR